METADNKSKEYVHDTRPPLIILTGPTAVGKTKLSISLAKELNGEIISADSMQVYKHMDIGTAKVKPEEMSGIKHYLIDEMEPEDEFNVVRFQKLAKQYMKEIYAKGKIPIIVGGTGFYIQSVLYDIDFEDTIESPIRNELEQLANERGVEYLHELLKSIDPVSYEKIHANNRKRVIRAIEYYRQTGKPISEHNEEQSKREAPYCFAYFVLNNERDKIYQNIDLRVDMMIEEGLVEEVMRLKKMGYSKNLVSMQGLGYKEILAYLDGECSLEEAVYILKRDTRHFAKRQLTWFRREKDVIWVDKQKFQENENEILNYMINIWKNIEKKNIAKNYYAE